MDNLVYKASNITFAYGKKTVIHDLNVEIKEGKITTLIGANGCGKTTLFHLLTNQLKPKEGTVLLHNNDIKNLKLKNLAKQVAIVHQHNTAPDDLTVEKLVGYGRTPHHSFVLEADSKEDEEKITWAMKITGVYEYKDMPVSKLSGGQKQRAWIAMALAQDTKILFLDEPTTYLDIKYQIEILKLVQMLNTQYGITIIMILHSINQALYYSDEIIAMKDGRIVDCGVPQEIISEQFIQDIYGIQLKIQELDHKKIVLEI